MDAQVSSSNGRRKRTDGVFDFQRENDAVEIECLPCQTSDTRPICFTESVD